MLHKVVSKLFGGWWRILPSLPADRGLILMTCGYIIATADGEASLLSMVQRYAVIF